MWPWQDDLFEPRMLLTCGVLRFELVNAKLRLQSDFCLVHQASFSSHMMGFDCIVGGDYPVATIRIVREARGREGGGGQPMLARVLAKGLQSGAC